MNFAKLVSTNENTISGLGPVNPLFNCQLKSMKENLIPNVLGNWNYLSEVRKRQLGEMGNFLSIRNTLCNTLHLLASFASETDKVFHKFE